MTTTHQPVLDPDHPEILEEARWWIRVTETRTRRASSRVALTARAQKEFAFDPGFGCDPGFGLLAYVNRDI